MATHIEGDVGTGGGDFAGRDMQNVELNLAYPPYVDPPKTLHQKVNQIDEKLDEVLEQFRGNPDKDIVGIRPRIRRMERNERIIFFLLALVLLMQMILSTGWHF